ncbi:MAG: nucleoside monophosphate kinase [bacterium]
MTDQIEAFFGQLLEHKFKLYPLYAPAGGGKEFAGNKIRSHGRASSESLVCSSVLRERAAIRDDLGCQLAQALPLIAKGTMVSDELVCAAIFERILHRVQFGVRSFVCDGFPRNLEQLHWLQQFEKRAHTPVIGKHIFLCQPFGRCLIQALRIRPMSCKREDATLEVFVGRWKEQFLALTLPLLTEILQKSPKKLAIVTSREVHKVTDIAAAMGYRGKELSLFTQLISLLPEFGQGALRDDDEAVLEFVHTLSPTTHELSEVKRLLANDGLADFRKLAS